MGNQSACCENNSDKAAEINARQGMPIAFVQLYQHSHEDQYFANVRTSLYKIMVANEPYPMIVEISHNENWDLTKVTIDHKDIQTV